jgi:hypothetical protein
MTFRDGEGTRLSQRSREQQLSSGSGSGSLETRLAGIFIGCAFSRAHWLLLVGSCVMLFLTCFWGVIFGGQQFAFRDVAHFYYPLYWRIQQQWASGQLPLWEPGANGGMPLLGSPVAAVLYPGKIIFALVPFAWGMRLYVLAHLALALVAMITLARTWGLSATGAWLAGVCYAFAGPVLSNYFNVIYLVGAAWLPLGFRAAYRWLEHRQRSGLVELSLVLAMQLLGGDPEAAYITVVCSLGYAFSRARRVEASLPHLWPWGVGLCCVAVGWAWLGRFLASRVHGSGSRHGQVIIMSLWVLGFVIYMAGRASKHRGQIVRLLAGIGGSCALAVVLTAVQIFPILAQTLTSIRWSGTPSIFIYDSSVLPYRLAEWIWPNVFGTFVHSNCYWMALLPPAGAQRPWPLSLYAGALPFILALSAVGLRGCPPWRTWMSAVAVITLWASIGEFAAPSGWSGREPTPSGGDDSFYGLLVTFLPGLRLFRLPYKLLVFTSLALASLAGLGWDRLHSTSGRSRATRVAAGLLLVTVLMLVLVLLQRDRLVAMMAAAPDSAHTVFGPLDVHGSFGALVRGLGHGTLFLTSALVLVLISSFWPRWAELAVVPIVAIDLAVANCLMVMTVPQSDFEHDSDIARAIRAVERAEPAAGPFRIHRLPSWVPIGWSGTGSGDRIRELLKWEINTLQPSFGLLHGLSYILADESETGRAGYGRFFEPVLRAADEQAATALGVEPGYLVLYQPRQAFDLWGARYFILPSFPSGWRSPNRSYAAFLDRTELIYPGRAEMEGPAHQENRARWLRAKDVQVRRNKGAFPRAWIVHSARLVRPVDASSTSAHDVLAVRIGFGEATAQNNLRLPAPDLRTTAYVETDNPQEIAPFLPGGPTDAGEQVSVQSENPVQVVISAHLKNPGLVVLADVFDSGWQLEVDGRPARTLRANLLMRAAPVAAGEHRLLFAYKPVWLRIGTVFSFAGFLILGGMVLWARARPEGSKGGLTSYN